MEQRCIFESRYECDEKTSLSTNTGTSRIETIISVSKVYDDTLHKELQTKLDGNKNLKILFHRNCVSRYASKSNLIAYNKNKTDSSPPVKKLRKSSAFDFRFHCLFCGEACEVNKDPKNPQNVRALRLLVEELLRPLFRNHDFRQMDDLLQQLEIISLKSKTSQLWIDCLIKPVFVILRYIRAEREADWALHLNSVREMMPLCFAAGHTHYARYALYYL